MGHGRLSIVVGEQREVIARAVAGFDAEADGFLRGAFGRVRRAEEGLAGGGGRRERPRV